MKGKQFSQEVTEDAEVGDRSYPSLNKPEPGPMGCGPAPFPPLPPVKTSS